MALVPAGIAARLLLSRNARGKAPEQMVNGGVADPVQTAGDRLLSRRTRERMLEDPEYLRAQEQIDLGGAAFPYGKSAGVLGALAQGMQEHVGRKEAKGIEARYQGEEERQRALLAKALESYMTPGGGIGGGIGGGQEISPRDRELIAMMLDSEGGQDAVLGKIIEQRFKKPAGPEFKEVNGSLVRINPDYSVEEAYRAPTEAKTRQVEMIGSQGPGVYVVDEATGEEIRKVGGIYNKPPSTVINNNNGGENAFSKKFGENMATNYQDIVTQAQAAPQNLARIGQFRGLIESGVPTGKVQDMSMPVRQFLNSVGVTDDQNISGQEALQSIGANFTLEAMASIKGPATDKDAAIVAASVPQLSKTPEGNAVILDIAERVEQYKMDMASFAADYVAQNGSLDANWIKAQNEWARSNPLLTPELRSRIDKAKSGKAGAAAPAGRPGIRNVVVE